MGLVNFRLGLVGLVSATTISFASHNTSKRKTLFWKSETKISVVSLWKCDL